jgi:hypothetical protein
MAQRPFARQRSVHGAAEAVDDSVAAEGHELHLAGLPGLEAHGRPGGNVEPHAARGGAVEAQRRIGLEEVVVRTDLDRPVAGVGDLQANRRTVRIQFDVSFREEILARLHGAHLIG